MLVKQHLVIDDRRDRLAGKEPSVETVLGLLGADALLELDKNFHQNLCIVRLVLLLLVEGLSSRRLYLALSLVSYLVDDNMVDFPIFVAFLLYVLLQVLIHVLWSHHVGEKDHPALHFTSCRHHKFLHDQLPARLAHALPLLLLLQCRRLQGLLLQLFLVPLLLHLRSSIRKLTTKCI